MIVTDRIERRIALWRIFGESNFAVLCPSTWMQNTSRVGSSFGSEHVRMERYRRSDSAITTTHRLPQRHLAWPRLSFLGSGYWSSTVSRRRDSTTPGRLYVRVGVSCLCVWIFTGVKVSAKVFQMCKFKSRRDSDLAGSGGAGGGLGGNPYLHQQPFSKQKKWHRK